MKSVFMAMIFGLWLAETRGESTCESKKISYLLRFADLQFLA